MSLIVETGTGAADSESYASVSDADTYHSKRGNTLWATMTTAEKEESLRRATDYMEQVYRTLWNGVRVNNVQALSWPREYVELEPVYDATTTDGYYPADAIPNEVKNACIEMAFKAASGELAADIDRVTVKEKLGPMEVEYDKNQPPYKKYRAIDNMLRWFLKSTNGSMFKTLVRV